MSRLPSQVIGDAYTNSRAMDVLTDITEIGNRMAGQNGERAGAEVIRDAFEAADLRAVEINEFDVAGWWRGDSSIEVDAGRSPRFESDHQIIALPGTPSGDVEAQLLDLDYGLPEDMDDGIEGKIVMARSDTPDDHDRWIHRMEKYATAADHGAVGFVFRNHVEGCLPPTGEIGDHDRPGPIPAVGVSKETGARLARYCEGGEPTARLGVDCRNAPSTSQNVEAVVGPDTESEVLVTAHIDAHDIAEGAGDNGAGSTLVAEIGRLLKAAEDDLDTRVRLVTFGAEEIGLCGAYHWVDTHDNDAVKAVINIDGAGNSRTPRVRSYEFEPMTTAFETVGEDLDVPVEVDDELSPHSDAWPFVEEGIPTVTAGSVSEAEGRGWGHTHADTLDKIDSRDLRALAISLATAAMTVAEDDRSIPHKERTAIREAIDEGYEQELKVIGRWPYGD
ncbi:MAG: M28 family peptidase [Halobacteriales archaeon]